MPRVGIRSRQAGRARPHIGRQHPKAYLATDNGLRCVLPVAPVEVDHDGLADPLETIEREGRKPIVARSSDQLRAMSFDLAVVSQTLGQSVQPRLNELEAIAGSGARVVFSYGTSERGTWRMARCSIKVTERVPFTNDAAKAVVSLSFLEASDVVVKVGPLSGGHQPPKGRARARRGTPGRVGAARAAAGERTHTVVPRDTLSAIALRYYGSASVWPKIADVNGVRDPRKLAVGTVLRLPATLP